MAPNDAFYEQLSPFTDFREATESRWYQALPQDWLVVITDVRGSTKAIEDGRYKDVNALGVASIVAVLNAVKPLRIPYVFGGDGATFCIPPSQRETVSAALAAARDMAQQAFELELRVGMVPVQRIHDDGHRILIGKHRVSPHYQQAMFYGDGLGHAEALVKDPASDNPWLVRPGTVTPSGDFSGFECRWNEIASPHDETVSLLIQARGNEASQAATYAEALACIRRIYGADEVCHPVRSDRLTLTSKSDQLATEVRVLTTLRGRCARFLHALTLPIITAIGRIIMRRGMRVKKVDWGAYKDELIANTDYRKFDEVIRMVISGTVAQREQLRRELTSLHHNGCLVFGIHAAPTALITCVIFDYNGDHVHFLDASNGGYAMAAREMKAQAKALVG